ncbi:hypothetical protein PVK06_005943 [Gossypium arboreum]|uniref:Reverse transcriptase n=2 Tax=Gossypium arboreum TaxID=29729 RepID=A0ABR0QWX0_GOSAR|nr:hypothetical protein PVK06_005943 [Gossypium arboreum]
MLQLAVKYFGNLFSTLEAGADDRLFGIVEKQISTVMNVKLLKQFNEEEIGEAAKDMAPLKAIGRLISDNVLIAYEVLHFLKMKKKGKKGFHADWVVLVMRCVCSVSYSVCLNRDMSDWFTPPRGLRQDDPLSPYLFLICAEGFSTLLIEAKQKGLMRGAPISRERLSIIHLFFAGDCIFFGDASSEGTNVVRNTIR